FGPPPLGAAKQTNRMSPPGVSAMYASFDSATALAEMPLPTREDRVWVGVFRTTRDAILVDLSRMPALPGRFAFDGRADRPMVEFLKHVARESAKPVARDDGAHIEYVPTQIFAEYVRHEIPEAKGIAFPSVQRTRGVN